MSAGNAARGNHLPCYRTTRRGVFQAEERQVGLNEALHVVLWPLAPLGRRYGRASLRHGISPHLDAPSVTDANADPRLQWGCAEAFPVERIP
jgi:hypothetical protein